MNKLIKLDHNATDIHMNDVRIAQMYSDFGLSVKVDITFIPNNTIYNNIRNDVISNVFSINLKRVRKIAPQKCISKRNFKLLVDPIEQRVSCFGRDENGQKRSMRLKTYYVRKSGSHQTAYFGQCTKINQT